MLENETLDYKEKFGSNTLKTLSAFVNTNGGTVIVGVSDDGEEKGVVLSNKGLEQITEKIVGKLGIHPSIEIVDLKDEKRKILKIHVERSNVPISFEGKYYKRVGNTTREMKGDELKGFFQRDVNWDYPIPAIRETLLNALIHRDYFKWNVQTQIKIFDDYIWFYNPGQLPIGITLKELENVHPSVPRNPLVVHVVYLSGLIEELGSGIKRMKTSMKNADLPLPRFEEKFNGFCVYLGKDIYSVERLKEMGLSERQIKAVLYVKENGKITNEEYRKLNNVSKPTATRDLLYLQENGMFKQVGKTGKGTYYILR